MSEPIIENVGGEYGATVRYQVGENKCYVEFFAAEILSRSVPDNLPGYWQKGATSYPCPDDTNFDNAERYVEGSVKWDGCSHVYFGDRNAYIHLCGRSEIDKLATILAAIYERCGELMKEADANLLDDEFLATKA